MTMSNSNQQNDSSNDSEDFGTATHRYGFECPGCHENRVIETDLAPDELEGRVFRCGNCDEKVLMNGHVEAPA